MTRPPRPPRGARPIASAAPRPPAPSSAAEAPLSLFVSPAAPAPPGPPSVVTLASRSVALDARRSLTAAAQQDASGHLRIVLSLEQHGCTTVLIPLPANRLTDVALLLGQLAGDLHLR